MKAVLLGDEATINRVYAQGRKERLAELCELAPAVIPPQDLAAHWAALKNAEAIFTTWSFPAMSSEQIAALPALKIVFYAAGSVQYFAKPFIDRNITVCSAWRANAIPVAEYTVAQILQSCKNVYRFMREGRSREKRGGLEHHERGVFGETVAILGAGAIGKLVISLLKPFNLKIVVFDPFLSAETAEALGVEKVSLEEAFARGYVVSNHLANLPATRKMLTGALFASMRPHATFINTGRGATTDEPAMTEVFASRPDLTALLDVTDPEPPAEGSPLYTLPNVFLTPHIAGSLGDEVVRMADYMLEEAQRWLNRERLQFAVTPAMLETMA